MQAFAAAAATAVVTAQTVAAHGARRSVEASERERVRWARELHDETLQELAALRIVALERAQAAAMPRRWSGPPRRPSSARRPPSHALRSLITDLRPAALDELGAGPALEALIDRTRRLRA